jgi:hypothetical protein
MIHLFQPDCLQCQAQMKALQAVHQEFARQDVIVLGVSHRGDAEDVRAVEKQLKLTYPLLVGTGSDLAKQFAAGDSLAIIDGKGTIRFAQVGYGEGDEKIWREDFGRLLAGEAVAKETVERERLRVGDRLPSIRLPAVANGKQMALTGEGGRLTFRDAVGSVTHPKAAVGFFCRY